MDIYELIEMARAAPEPSPEQCSSNARIPLPDGRTGTAGWYPKMGGYSGRCLIIPDGTCADVFVWHDGQFPFTHDHWDRQPGDLSPEPPSPVVLHHCDGDQFVHFGRLLNRTVDEEAPGDGKCPGCGLDLDNADSIEGTKRVDGRMWHTTCAHEEENIRMVREWRREMGQP